MEAYANEKKLIDWRGRNGELKTSQATTVVQRHQHYPLSYRPRAQPVLCQSIMCLARLGPREEQLVSLRADAQAVAPIAASHRRHGNDIRPASVWSSLPNLPRRPPTCRGTEPSCAKLATEARFPFYVDLIAASTFQQFACHCRLGLDVA